MKKLILFFFVLICYSQQQVEVTYLVQLPEFSDNIPSNLKSILANSQNSSKKLSFILEYKDNKSKFYKKDIGIEDEDLKVASILVNSDDTYFFDHTMEVNYKLIHESELFKKNEFIVKDDYNLNWVLIDTTMIINEYLCKKASVLLKKEIYNTKKDLEVEAWYAPDISIPSGPKNFVNLPGLIFYLKINNVVFYANKINFDKSIKPIDIPKSDKIVNSIEFNEIENKRIKEAMLNKFKEY